MFQVAHDKQQQDSPGKRVVPGTMVIALGYDKHLRLLIAGKIDATLHLLEMNSRDQM